MFVTPPPSNSFIYVPSSLIISIFAFFGSIQYIAPWQCQQNVTRGEFFLEDMMKISSFWVSVFCYVYFIWLDYMYSSVLCSLALSTSAPPPRAPPPSPSNLFLFMCAWVLGIIYLFINPLYLSLLSLLFREYTVHCPVAVSAKDDARRFFFLEDTMKFNSFWVSVFFYVYFICFSYMYGSVL